MSFYEFKLEDGNEKEFCVLMFCEMFSFDMCQCARGPEVDSAGRLKVQWRVSKDSPSGDCIPH